MPQHLKQSICPYCAIANPLLTLNSSFQTANTEGTVRYMWSFFACSTCGGVVMERFHIGSQQKEYLPSPEDADEALPERARDFLTQAIASVQAPAGAVILAASAVDAMLKAKGLKEGGLNGRIKQAAKEHLITSEMAEWAHSVRLDANDQRHADENAPLPIAADAERSIAFAKALGQFLFVLPAMVSKGRQKAEPEPEDPRRVV